MRDRSEGVARCKALYILALHILALHNLALARARQQDIGGQDAVIANATIFQPGGGPVAAGLLRRACCGGPVAAGSRHTRAERHGARSILSPPLGTGWKAKGGHRYRSQDRGPVLQHLALGDDPQRPRRRSL
jgi:hypothetical protein